MKEREEGWTRGKFMKGGKEGGRVFFTSMFLFLFDLNPGNVLSLSAALLLVHGRARTHALTLFMHVWVCAHAHALTLLVLRRLICLHGQIALLGITTHGLIG